MCEGDRRMVPLLLWKHPEAPDHKFLEQILKKMSLKKQKIEKILSLIEKYANMKISTLSGMSKSTIIPNNQQQNS